MASTAELQLLIKARDEASGVLGAVSKKAGGLANVMGKAIRAGALAGGVAVAGLGIAAIKMGLDFEKGMAEVRTLLPELSEEGFGQLKQGVLDLSKELGIATSEAVPGLYSAISLGVPPDNVLSFMETAAKASIGGVTDLDTSVKVIQGTIKSYGEGVLDAQQVSDILFTAVKLGGTTFSELGASLSKVLPTAAAIGVSFEDVTSQIAVMTSQMVPTAEAVTLMKQGFAEASKTGTKLSDAIVDLTGRSFAELIKKGASTSEIFDSLRSSMPLQEFKDLFGSNEAMNAALLITGPNAQAAADALAEAKDSAGAGEAAFDVMADTASNKLGVAINLLKVTLTELGIKILPLLTKGLDKVLPFLEENLPKAIEKIEGVIEDARPVVERFVKSFAKGIGVLKDAIEPLFKFIIGNKAVLIGAIAAIGVAILLAFGPGAIAIVAIIGLIALIGVIKDNWDSLKVVLIPVGIALGIVAGVILAAMIPALIGMTAAGIAAVLPWLLLAIPIIAIVAVIALVVAAILLLIKHFDKVKAALGDAADFIGDKAGEVKDFLVDAFNFVLDFLRANWPFILPILLGPLGLVALAVIKFRDDIIGFFRDLKDKVFEIVGNLADGVVDLVTDFKDRLIRGFTNLVNGVVGLVTELKDRLVRGFTNIWNKVVEIFNFLRTDVQRTIANTRDDVVRTILSIPGKLGNLLNKLVQKGKDLLRGFVNGYAKVWLTILAFFTKLPGVLARRIKAGVGALWRVGFDFLSGLWQGIKARAISLFNDLAQLAKDIIGAIKDPLGVLSPSKVMKGVGENLMEGLRQGIEGQAFKVNATVGNVAGGIVGAAAGVAAPPQAASGRPLVVILELDGRQIAKIVAPHFVDEARLRLGRRL